MLTRLSIVLQNLKANRKGVTALEYAVLAGLVITAVAAGGAVLTTDLTTSFGHIGTALTAHGA